MWSALLNPLFESGRIWMVPHRMTTGDETFYRNIPVFSAFGRVMDPALYTRVPDDWIIGVADIVE
jgi:hypothetical protein